MKRQGGNTEDDRETERDQRGVEEPKWNHDEEKNKILIGLRIGENAKEPLVPVHNSLGSGHKSRQPDRAAWPER